MRGTGRRRAEPCGVVLIGYPFIPIGRGEDLRCAFRALRALGLDVTIRDVYLPASSDRGLKEELGSVVVQTLSPHTNVFYINGDEVERVLDRLGGWPAGARNIICPQWELSIYPREWVEQLDRFDEVWAPSRFVRDALQGSMSRPVVLVPLPAQPRITSFLSRRHFGLSESAYVFLSLFDFRSYIDRKNPFGVITAFERVCARRPDADTVLVLKFSGANSAGGALARRRFREAIEQSRSRDRIVVIDRVLTDNESKNLVRHCDCFVSLHRSEGFGRGLAEAMFFNKPVVATGYSGNLDFMHGGNSCLVGYTLVDVKEGEYPHAAGQVWADPDLDHAADCMVRLLDDRGLGMGLGEQARCDIMTHFSSRAVGLTMEARLAGPRRGDGDGREAASRERGEVPPPEAARALSIGPERRPRTGSVVGRLWPR